MVPYFNKDTVDRFLDNIYKQLDDAKNLLSILSIADKDKCDFDTLQCHRLNDVYSHIDQAMMIIDSMQKYQEID